MKKQIIAGITAIMTITGNAATVIHAEDDTDYRTYQRRNRSTTE